MLARGVWGAFIWLYIYTLWGGGASRLLGHVGTQPHGPSAAAGG
jgi:hypothetical protein